MDNSSISIFGNKIFLEIIKEINFFSKFSINYYNNLNLCINDVKKENHIMVFFNNKSDENLYNKIKNLDLPIIIITKEKIEKSQILGDLKEILICPFNIIEFKKKLTFLIAKNQFKKNSLIYLNDYIIDRNERRIKKDDIYLQLSEKEINFLILFTKTKDPITRNKVLKSVWHYSLESETHTLETHIHRLRKKILEKFGDKNFIKNNNKGYYI